VVTAVRISGLRKIGTHQKNIRIGVSIGARNFISVPPVSLSAVLRGGAVVASWVLHIIDSVIHSGEAGCCQAETEISYFAMQ
jgi:hypothetical protein